jgi:hypothetical protein
MVRGGGKVNIIAPPVRKTPQNHINRCFERNVQPSRRLTRSIMSHRLAQPPGRGERLSLLRVLLPPAGGRTDSGDPTRRAS